MVSPKPCNKDGKYNKDEINRAKCLLGDLNKLKKHTYPYQYNNELKELDNKF